MSIVTIIGTSWGNCPGGIYPGGGELFRGNCPGGKNLKIIVLRISWGTIDHGGSCPGRCYSGVQCPRENCLGGNFMVRELSREQLSRGE